MFCFFVLEDRHDSACFPLFILYCYTDLSSVWWSWESHPRICFSNTIVHLFRANIPGRDIHLEEGIFPPLVSHLFFTLGEYIRTCTETSGSRLLLLGFVRETANKYTNTFCSLVDLHSFAGEKNNEFINHLILNNLSSPVYRVGLRTQMLQFKPVEVCRQFFFHLWERAVGVTQLRVALQKHQILFSVWFLVQISF